MNETEIEAAVQWFRQGLKDKHDKHGRHQFPVGTHWHVQGAYEAGVDLAKQMQCEKTGHKDHVSHWNYGNGDTKHYVRYEDRECGLCGRSRAIVVASFDNQAEFDAYNLERWKKKQEAANQ